METSISLYENLTLIFGIAGGVMLVLSVVLFFVYNMKNVISKALGVTEKQELKKIKARAKATEKASRKKAPVMLRKVKREQEPGQDEATDILPSGDTGQDEATDILPSGDTGQDEATDILPFGDTGQDEPTDILSAGLPGRDGPENKVFTAAPEGFEPVESGDTMVLNENPETEVLSGNSVSVGNRQFMLIRHIMLVHTDEAI